MKNPNCEKYPCFFNGKPKRVKGRIVWKCSSCSEKGSETDVNAAARIIEILKSLEGLGRDFYVLSEQDKKELSLIEHRNNTGMLSALSRDVAILFSHNSDFRGPVFPVVLLVNGKDIIGEMTDSGKRFYWQNKQAEYLLPPIPFPEAEINGVVNVVSASPGREAHEYIKGKISIKGNDASLVLGFDFA